jgi:hypothetical protein
MVANEVNNSDKFSLFIGDENTGIWGNFHPFDFTPKKSFTQNYFVSRILHIFVSKFISESPSITSALKENGYNAE